MSKMHFIKKSELTINYNSTTSKEGVQGIRTGFFHFFESKEVRRTQHNI